MDYTDLFVGGRGIGIKIVYDQFENIESAFDYRNMICICPGVLSGTSAPSTSRLQIVGVGTNNLLANAGCGCFIPAEIKYAGYDLITVVGKSDNPVYLYIYNEKIQVFYD